jgi:hypothetical protein
MVKTRFTEEEVKKLTVEWLKKQGFEIQNVSPPVGHHRHPTKRGRKSKAAQPDIKARKGTRYYYVEAKGDPSSAGRFYDVIGQIVTKMVTKTPIEYAIALSPSYERFLHLMPIEAQKRTKIRILIPQVTSQSRRLPKIIWI